MTCVDSLAVNNCILQLFEGTTLKHELHLADIQMRDLSNGGLAIADKPHESWVNLSADTIATLGHTLASLKTLLETERANCLNSGGGGGGGSTAFSDGSIFAAVDPANPSGTPFFIEVTYSEASQTFTYSRTDGTPVTEGTDFQPIVSQGGGSNIKTICKCDVAGDGSVTATYVKTYIQTDDGTTITSTFAGDFTDEGLTTPYTIIGTETNCSDVGTDAQGLPGLIEITNTTWSPSSLTESFTVLPVAGSPTFTDSFSNTTTLPSFGITWTKPSNVTLMNTTPVVTAGPTDTVIISYINIG